MEDQETRAERYQRIRERVEKRAEVLRAEMAAAMGEVRTRLDGQDERLDRHDEELSALKAQVGAMVPVIRQAYVSEDLPVPPALQPEPLLRLASSGG